MSRICDFKIEYTFIPQSEGGRRATPNQGYRPDFFFDDDDLENDGIYMIWPCFLDQKGVPLKQGRQVAESGVADMYIVNPDMREAVHRHKVMIGVDGYLMEGGRKVATARVIEIVGLHANQV